MDPSDIVQVLHIFISPRVQSHEFGSDGKAFFVFDFVTDDYDKRDDVVELFHELLHNGYRQVYSFHYNRLPLLIFLLYDVSQGREHHVALRFPAVNHHLFGRPALFLHILSCFVC